MTEEERTVEVDAETEADVTTGPAPDRRSAVYGGEALTTTFDDRVDATASEGLGRVVGLTRTDDELTLTVETQDGRLAEFALADPAERRLDGRLRRLFHQVGGADGVTGGLVPLTTADGEVAIDWERVPAAPANPSLEARATGRDAASTDVAGAWSGVRTVETALAGGASVAALIALVVGTLAGGGPALVTIAVLQAVVAGALLTRTRLD